jgi:hypothetical protein
MNALIKFAQGRDVFIYDFVAVVKFYLADLYMMYYDLLAGAFPSVFKCGGK